VQHLDPPRPELLVVYACAGIVPSSVEIPWRSSLSSLCGLLLRRKRSVEARVVRTKRGDELGYPFEALQPAKPLGCLLKTDRHPAKDHGPVLPFLDVVMNPAKNTVEVLDWIRCDQHAFEGVDKPKREDGGRFLQPLSQRIASPNGVGNSSGG
jgi:hypothetical protein